MKRLLGATAALGLVAALAACDNASPPTPPAPAIVRTTPEAAFDAWFDSLDVEIPDSDLTSKALELHRGMRMGGWEVRGYWESRVASLPEGRRRVNARRILDRIDRWDGHCESAMGTSEAWQLLHAPQRDGNELSLALLADLPMPGIYAAWAMDALTARHDDRTLDYLRLAREVNALGMPGDGGPSMRLGEQLNHLIADLEREAAAR